MLAPTVKNVIYKHGKNAFSCRYSALNNSHLPSYELLFYEDVRRFLYEDVRHFLYEAVRHFLYEAVRRFLPFCLPPGGRGTALAVEGACVL